jgi:thiosulfate/3-mercaptopyruvate sulfurtransferase
LFRVGHGEICLESRGFVTGHPHGGKKAAGIPVKPQLFRWLRPENTVRSGGIRFGDFMKRFSLAAILFALTLLPAAAQPGAAVNIPQSVLIQPADLANDIKAGKAPVILQVGFSVLYQQAHIPGAIYAGPGNKEEGIDNLKTQAKNLDKSKALVIYCGCCPWEKCPNIAAAWKELTAEGFKNLKVLYLPANFGENWADKGYPVVRG